MTDNPSRDTERISATPCTLARLSSTGVVMYCSISCAASAGDCVRTTT